MGQTINRHEKRDRQRMDLRVIAAGVTILMFLGALVKWVLNRIYLLPDLALIRRIQLNSQGVPHVCDILLMVKNSGKKSVSGALIELTISKPLDIRPGYGLFFDEKIGDLELAPATSFVPSPANYKARRYLYRLKPSVFVNPGQAPLVMARLIVCANEQTVAEDLDYQLEWTIQSAGFPSTHGYITLKGDDLKRILMKNLYESGCVAGYELPSGNLPPDNLDD